MARHSEGSSAPRASLVAVHAESRVRYARKHSPAWSARLDTGGVAFGLATHALTSVLRGNSPSGHLLALKSTLGAGRT